MSKLNEIIREHMQPWDIKHMDKANKERKEELNRLTGELTMLGEFNEPPTNERSTHMNLGEKVLHNAKTAVQEGWTRKTRARDNHGDACEPASRDAVKWCAYGAIERGLRQTYDALQEKDPSRYMEFLDLSTELVCDGSMEIITRWNDNAGITWQKEVIEMFDKAIERHNDEAGAAKTDYDNVLDAVHGLCILINENESKWIKGEVE